jgi:hypothetical protein
MMNLLMRNHGRRGRTRLPNFHSFIHEGRVVCGADRSITKVQWGAAR